MIRLFALGTPYLEGDDGAPLDGLVRQTKRFALLVHLLCDGRGVVHRRDDLIATFWPESDGARGRNALRQTLFAIRGQLGEDLLKSNGGEEMAVDSSRIRSDAAEFRTAVEKGALDEALALYRGPFLEGFYLPDCPEFEFWVDRSRIELEAMANAAAKNLAHIAEGHRDLEAAVHWWRRALQLRPFDEKIARRLISLLAGDSNRGKALAEFNRFRERMVHELAMEPSQKTVALANSIKDGTFDPAQQWIGDRRQKPVESPDSALAPAFRYRRGSDGSPF